MTMLKNIYVMERNFAHPHDEERGLILQEVPFRYRVYDSFREVDRVFSPEALSLHLGIWAQEGEEPMDKIRAYSLLLLQERQGRLDFWYSKPLWNELLDPTELSMELSNEGQRIREHTGYMIFNPMRQLWKLPLKKGDLLATGPLTLSLVQGRGMAEIEGLGRVDFEVR